MAAAGQLPIRFEGEAPVRARRVRASALYDAASSGPRTTNWYAPTVGANASVVYNLTNLRNRSRQAARNDGFAKGAIDALVYNIVGYGIKPLSGAKDESIRKAITELWNRWVGQSASDGRLGFYGQQLQVVRCWLEGGDGFILLHPRRPEDKLPVPLHLQNLEPEQCPHTYTTRASNGNSIKAGIEFDRIGRRVAYYFCRERVQDLDWSAGDLRRVAVGAVSFKGDRVLHLYDPLRAGQIRGVPHLTQALVKLNDLDKYDDATLLRVQIGNLFAGFLRRPGMADPELSSLTGQEPAKTTVDGRQVVSMEPGTMQVLDLGEEVEFSKPPDPPLTYPAFMGQQLRSACAACGVPYEVLTNDWGAINDRMARVILHEFRRRVMAFQYSIVAHQVCQPIWSAWLQLAVSSGALPISQREYSAEPERFNAVKWMPQAWPYIHPVQDVKASSDAIKAGLTSRSAAVAEQGEDAETIDAEHAADNERAERLGLKYETDTRQGSSAAQPTVAPPPGDGQGGEEAGAAGPEARAATTPRGGGNAA